MTHPADPAADGRGPVVCVGAHMQALFMHVERIPKEGETVRGWGYRESVDGGKVANVAVAAVRLGAPVRLVTIVGTDQRSEWWLEFFRKQNIDTRGILQFEGPMDIGPALLPPSRIPALVSVSDLSARLDAVTVEQQAELIREASVVACALESPRDGVEAAFRIAKASGATTILNASPAADLSADLTRLTDVLVVNQEEAVSLSGRASPPEGAATLVGPPGPGSVIVTAGPQGAYAARLGEPVAHLSAPKLSRVVDTTGAGDAFVGALAVRLRAGDEILESASFAIRAASFACTREYTMPSFPTLEDLRVFDA